VQSQSELLPTQAAHPTASHPPVRGDAVQGRIIVVAARAKPLHHSVALAVVHEAPARKQGDLAGRVGWGGVGWGGVGWGGVGWGGNERQLRAVSIPWTPQRMHASALTKTS
jgi:hypothetical protein